MSLVGSIVSAFLVAAGRPAKTEDHADQKIEALKRSHTRLIDRIEQLERELNLAQAALEHWRGEAARFARQNREWRAYQPQQDPRQALQQAMAQSQALMQQAQMRQALNLHLAGLAQQTQYAQQNTLEQAFWCNCVPSRAQVWDAQHGLVQQLNDNGRE